MFNRTTINNKTEYIPYDKTITIHEHKAVTDECIKLLNEFTDKAKENLLYSVHVKQTYLQGIVLFIRDEIVNNLGYDIHFKFLLNGNEFKFRTFISDDEWNIEKYKSNFEPAVGIAIRLLNEKFCEEISKELLKSHLPQLNSFFKHK